MPPYFFKKSDPKRDRPPPTSSSPAAKNPTALLSCIVSGNFDLQGLFVDSDVEPIGAAADLAIFDVALVRAARKVNESGVRLAAESTGVVSR